MKYALVEFYEGGQLYTYSCSDEVKKGNVVEVTVDGYLLPQLVIVKKVVDKIPKSTPKTVKIKRLGKVISQTPKNTVFDIRGMYSFMPDYNLKQVWKKTKCCVDEMYEISAYLSMHFVKDNIRASFDVFKNKNSRNGIIEVNFDDWDPNTDFEEGNFMADELHFSSKYQMNYMLFRIKKAIYDYSLGKISYDEAADICSDPDDIVSKFKRH